MMVAALVMATLSPRSSLAGASRHETPALDALIRSSATIRDYSVRIEAHEVRDGVVDDRVLRFSFRRPDRAKLEVQSGRGAGMRLLWFGGDTVRVRGGILSFVPLSLRVDDRRVTSLRGNTMLRAELGPALACFAQHRDAVTESSAPRAGGHAATRIALTMPAGIRCAGDSSQDAGIVTRDVLVVDRRTDTVLRRERYAGDTLVERWTLNEVHINLGLTDADFR